MIVKAKKISRTFYRKRDGSNVFTAVEPCDFLLPGGMLTVISGRSGSGKSTLLNMLAGILQPSGGVVEYDGESLYEKNDRELSELRGRVIGYVPQGRSAVMSLTVLENVLLPLLLAGEKDDGTAEALLKRFGIDDLKDAMPKDLSGGELRRMAIARALIRRPKVIFADEPTGDLDDENTQIVFSMLKEQAKEGAAVLAVTHETDAGQYADRMFSMNAGKLSECM